MLVKNIELVKYSFCVFLILLLTSAFSYAEIFKWVDENEQTHYSDKNGSKSKVEKLKLDSSPNIFPGNSSKPTVGKMTWVQNHVKLKHQLIKAKNPLH
jgi:hypothetical protein